MEGPFIKNVKNWEAYKGNMTLIANNLWKKFRRKQKTTFGVSRHKPRDRFVQKNQIVCQKYGAKNISQSTYLKWIKVININRNKDMTLRPKSSTHKSSDLYWAMFASHTLESTRQREFYLFLFYLSPTFLNFKHFVRLKGGGPDFVFKWYP